MSVTRPALQVDDLTYRYGSQPVLEHLEFQVAAGEIFGWLGPNGSGKTTLFRLLSTLLPIQSGRILVGELDVALHPARVRQCLGVTFQSPSLDRKLTVLENLRHQGALYGLTGQVLRERIAAVVERLRLSDRLRDLTQTLSGGWQRRVEIAKALLHRPQILLLDEPSTGLDPGARLEFWAYLRELQQAFAITIVVTTHLLDEAEQCDRLGILHQGRVVATGTPTELRQSVGEAQLTIQTPEAGALAAEFSQRWGLKARVLGEALRIEEVPNPEWMSECLRDYGSRMTSMTWGRATLEDVFIQRTGHRFWEAADVPAARH